MAQYFSNLTNKIVYAAKGNYTPGTGKWRKANHVTIHHAVNLNADQTAATFAKVGRNGSCNYAVDDKQIIGIVDEDDIQHCDSNWDWNKTGYSIEMSNSSTAAPYPVSDATYDRTARLVADIFKRCGIKKAISGDTVRWHRDAPGASTACPGQYTWDRRQQLCDRINQYLDPVKVVWEPMDSPRSMLCNNQPTNLYNLPSLSVPAFYDKNTRVDGLVDKAKVNGLVFLRSQRDHDLGVDRGYSFMELREIENTPPEVTPPVVEPPVPEPAVPVPQPEPEEPSVPDPGEIEGEPADNINWKDTMKDIKDKADKTKETIEETTEILKKSGVKLQLTDKVYDACKWVLMIGAVVTAVWIGVSPIWAIDQLIVDTVTAVVATITAIPGALIILSDKPKPE